MIENSSLIVIISGPSGAGKNAVSEPILRDTSSYACSVSYTTRKNIRPGERDGVDYHFITDEEFIRGIQNDEFLEWEQVFENKYGTKMADFEALLNSGKTVLMQLDVKGAQNIKKMYKNVITIFILPPDPRAAEERLKGRGTESEESQEIRKARAAMELSYKDQYDYCIVNDDLATAQKELREIIEKDSKKLKALMA